MGRLERVGEVSGRATPWTESGTAGLLTVLLGAQVSLFALAAVSGKIPAVILTLFRALLTL